MSDAVIKTFIQGELQTNTYIISKNGHALIIDPTGDNAPLDKYILDNNLTLDGMLLTHGHFDHTELVKYYQEKGLKCYIEEFDKDLLSSKANLALIVGNYNFPYTTPDILIKNDEILEFPEFSVKVMLTSGHTKGSVCYVFDEENVIFSGDTLFKLSYGRTDYFGGSFDDLLSSFSRLFKLTKDYKVFPGHGDSTTLNYEKRNNPIFLDANEDA